MISPTANNSITSVPGVHVGHFTLAEGEIQTGVSVILPYPLLTRNRKLFVGSFASGDWNEWTGLHVAQDFGTLSSPIVLCNATTSGIAYDAMISFGHQRAPDLPIDNAWPPIVIGIDDGYLNDLRQRRITHDQILHTLYAAQDQFAGHGDLGIGRGLCAGGGKGGVGEAARTVRIDEIDYTCGVFLAANGGKALSAGQNAGVRNVASSFILILATDAPLLPGQLRHLAEAGMRGLQTLGFPQSNDLQLALAFSTSNTLDNTFDEAFQLFAAKLFSDELLAPLFVAAAEVSTEALCNSLRAATAVTGRKGRTAIPVDLSQILTPK